MTCPRCQGLMLPDALYDLLDDTGKRWAQVSRCVNCGNIVDPLILQHRTLQPARQPDLVAEVA